MVTMKTRRAPLLMTAASGVLAAALAATPLVMGHGTTLQAVPAAPAAAAQSPDATPSMDRADQVTRDLDRPALADVATQRAAAQAQTSQAISTEAGRLTAEQKAKAEAEAKAAAEQKAKADAAAKVAAEQKAKEAAAAKAAADKAAADKAAADKASGGYSGSPRDMAKQIAAKEYGWGDQQFQCYDNIIMHESEWVVTATNPSSGAYGIPQALPGSKMASAGSDWRTNPVTQIHWGLDYVKGRYGTPCQAWSFKSANGWY